MDLHTSTADDNQTGQTSRLQCQECQQTFGRVEHLTRHSRSHAKERSLKCSYCRKGFYRIDALRRHEQVHKEPKRSALGKGARACLPCANARRKCTGESPCLGCQKRSLECQYPASGRRGTTSTLPHANGSLSSPGDEVSPLSPFDQRTTNSHESPMSWSNTSGSPGQVQGSPSHADPSQTSSGVEQLNSFSSEANPLQNQDSIRTEERNISQDIDSPDYPRRQQLTDGGQMSRSRTSGSEFHQLHPLQHSVSLNNANSDQLTTPWLNNFQSINWLPEDWNPDFHMNGEILGSLDHNHDIPYTDHVPSSYQQPPRTFSLSHSQALLNHNHISPRTADLHEVSSPGSQSTQSAGRFYVDGDGARLPRVRRAPYRQSDTNSRDASNGTLVSSSILMFPDLGQIPTGDGNTTTRSFDELPISVYDEITRIYHLSCESSTMFPNFYGDSFPSSRALSYFVHLFTQHFRPSLPFLHPATFDISSTHWLLTLAMSALGSQYADNESSGVLVVAMHEFVRRAIMMAIELDGSSKPGVLVLAQVKLLNCVGMMYCGDDRLRTLARGYHSDLAAFCTVHWAGPSVAATSKYPERTEQVDQDWQTWIQTETIRRTGYCIWLLDCMWSFHLQMRPILKLEDAKVPIPCQEVLWEAESSLDWEQLYACAAPSVSLHDTIKLTYVEKYLRSSTGEFSRILCVHALFHRTWEVEKYLKQPLTLWTPTAEKQSLQVIEKHIPIWLPGNSIYSKWRNSACDCLDVLHWHANSVIGAASGMEHPTVLHLHLARVILLTPIQSILELTKLLTDASKLAEDVQVMTLRKYVQRWALEDQHKARLAVIHAGVLFWHVRRYSSDAFYESSSVILATLALWAYGTFAPHTSPKQAAINDSTTPNSAPQDSDQDAEATSLFPTSIQLDRPADDELVQLFVKRGQSMRANITGVGNLCSAKGPLRVLNEGQNLLKGLKVWGESKKGIDRLQKLSDVCMQERDGGRVG
ncbi:hypothetical protein ONS95_009368 [Cadophora gregata]|uniref:uncharacterized protein n=2 Tax=Cadophora gregata TaxID=51156 RepID=UPI0026DC5632|nr:uncharacterized protein ONS95_009368 [Cadophora gregata]KAK0124407.1 hypothetical protein ONS95_009368 [Cadophora gregata]KAK0129740.1 hypothetical protein ONS96_000297 [Cadophora gregata f. sp. sojae]